jgi:deoxyribodipyrimidine photo-lyase
MLVATQPPIPAARLAASHAAALGCWHQFSDQIADYARMRNHVAPDLRGVSRLSPFIRHRLITEWEIATEVYAAHDPAAAGPAKFLEELAWRTYWKGWLEQHPTVWQRYRDAVRVLRRDPPTADYFRYQQAVAGNTHIPLFNEWVHTLTATGYLHNHVRMWFASIWIFTLQLPWQWGADLFSRHLLDGDPAVNTLSWRWVGGLHTPGKRYLATVANIRQYCPQAAIDPAALAHDGDPLTEEAVPPCVPLAQHTPVAITSALPSLSQSPAGLLITPEDTAPERSPLSGAAITTIAALAGDDVVQTEGWAQPVVEWQDQALADAAGRATAHWDGALRAADTLSGWDGSRPQVCDCVGTRTRMPVYHGRAPVWGEAVVRWARLHNLRAIHLLEPPVGPWRDRLPGLREALRRDHVQLVIHRRAWDVAHWPHATHGFFQFRQNLGARINQLIGQ